MKIGPRCIGKDCPPFIIAELSGNHNGSLERALATIDAAAAAGASAVKLQTYTADTMTLDERGPDFTIDDPKSPWNGRTLYDLYAQAHTPWEWHEALFERARQRGMLCFSTPFDASAVTFLERFDPPAYKVASFEITDAPLVAAIAATGRPMILSTGMASEAEVAEALALARTHGARDVALMKCTSTYPANPADSNLAAIPMMRRRFACEIGLSDHTPGIGVAVAAVGIGATIVEKHVTLARADGGVDAAFSLEPHELASLVVEAGRACAARGYPRLGPSQAERPSLQFRRSIYVTADVEPGEPLNERNLRIVRPGYGLEPKQWPNVVGRRAARAIKRGTALSWDVVRDA